jgi:DNA-binding MarR family transcriptional regulator
MAARQKLKPTAENVPAAQKEKKSGLGAVLPPGGAPRLDRLIHERLRLGILSALSVNESLTFNELKKLLDTTDGNLSVHARKLEEAGYVSCAKSFEGRIPRTDYRLSAAGKKALERYLDHMEALIQAMREK